MPSDLKRINLTIPDDVYEALREYEKSVGINRDATVCLSIIVQFLVQRGHCSPFGKPKM